MTVFRSAGELESQRGFAFDDDLVIPGVVEGPVGFEIVAHLPARSEVDDGVVADHSAVVEGLTGDVALANRSGLRAELEIDRDVAFGECELVMLLVALDLDAEALGDQRDRFEEDAAHHFKQSRRIRPRGFGRHVEAEHLDHVPAFVDPGHVDDFIDDDPVDPLGHRGEDQRQSVARESRVDPRSVKAHTALLAGGLDSRGDLLVANGREAGWRDHVLTRLEDPADLVDAREQRGVDNDVGVEAEHLGLVVRCDDSEWPPSRDLAGITAGLLRAVDITSDQLEGGVLSTRIDRKLSDRACGPLNNANAFERFRHIILSFLEISKGALAGDDRQLQERADAGLGLADSGDGVEGVGRSGQ